MSGSLSFIFQAPWGEKWFHQVWNRWFSRILLEHTKPPGIVTRVRGGMSPFYGTIIKFRSVPGVCDYMQLSCSCSGVYKYNQLYGIEMRSRWFYKTVFGGTILGCLGLITIVSLKVLFLCWDEPVKVGPSERSSACHWGDVPEMPLLK